MLDSVINDFPLWFCQVCCGIIKAHNHQYDKITHLCIINHLSVYGIQQIRNKIFNFYDMQRKQLFTRGHFTQAIHTLDKEETHETSNGAVLRWPALPGR